MKKDNAGRIQEFADDLRNFVDTPEQWPAGENDEQMQKILLDAVMAATVIARIAKEVEFYMQGDISKSTFLTRYKKIEKRIAAELADITE